MQIIECGLVEYREAFAIQERLADGIAFGREDETLLLLEHPPVYTIGSGGDQANVLDTSLTVERINRGGDVTWHGPGQVVGYPLVNLGRRGRDLHRWLCFLEEILIRTVGSFGVKGRRVSGRTGVWAERGKLASIGVGVRRWVTMHGFALNIDPDLSAFERINPCGLAGCPVTSLAHEGVFSPSSAATREQIIMRFEALLNEWLPEENSGNERRMP